MKADTERTYFDHNAFMFEVPAEKSAAARNCDMCDLSGSADVYCCVSGVRLCPECQGDLMGLPSFTHQQIGRFLIGNVL